MILDVGPGNRRATGVEIYKDYFNVIQRFSVERIWTRNERRGGGGVGGNGHHTNASYFAVRKRKAMNGCRNASDSSSKYI